MGDYAEGDVIGYVVVVWNQASHRPEVVDYSFSDDRDSVLLQLADEQARTAEVGRRERYAVGTVVTEGPS